MVDRTLEETLAAVRNASTRTDSIIADRASLKQQVADLIAAQGQMSPELQQGLNDIFDIEDSDAKKIDAAISAGTTEPAPPPSA